MANLPDISGSLTISGPGASKLTVTRDNAAGHFRIFRVETTGTVTISGLTITNGLISISDPGNEDAISGGGIQNLNSGTVNVNNCVVTGNAAYRGGGVENFSTGTVNVINSVITNNAARAPAGASLTVLSV